MRLIRFGLVVAARDGIEDAELIARLEEALNNGRQVWIGAEIDSKKKTRQRSSITCAECGEKFLAGRVDAKYCSDSCRVTAFAKKRRAEHV